METKKTAEKKKTRTYLLLCVIVAATFMTLAVDTKQKEPPRLYAQIFALGDKTVLLRYDTAGMPQDRYVAISSLCEDAEHHLLQNKWRKTDKVLPQTAAIAECGIFAECAGDACVHLYNVAPPRDSTYISNAGTELLPVYLNSKR